MRLGTGHGSPVPSTKTKSPPKRAFRSTEHLQKNGFPTRELSQTTLGEQSLPRLRIHLTRNPQTLAPLKLSNRPTEQRPITAILPTLKKPSISKGFLHHLNPRAMIALRHRPLQLQQLARTSDGNLSRGYDRIRNRHILNRQRHQRLINRIRHVNINSRNVSPDRIRLNNGLPLYRFTRINHNNSYFLDGAGSTTGSATTGDTNMSEAASNVSP